MVPWLIPALKAVLPHVGTIVAAASPAFTKLRGDAPQPALAQMQQQIGELQQAAGQNADHIRELAEQLQRTVTALEEAAVQAQDRMTRTHRMSLAACGVSLLAAVVAMASWWVG